MSVAPQIIPAPTGGQKTRQDFGGHEMTVTGETASTALATQARAAVEARFVMAMQRPRQIENVRVRILDACRRPMFAENAIYSKPVGWGKNKETGEWGEQYAEGLNIRFAEEAIRCLGNAMTETTTLYDDSKKRIIRLSATDFESNVVHYKDITVEKTVERTKLKENQIALGVRTNSNGKPVYTVEATEDDMAVKEGARAAKAIRDKILMLIPSDIQEEAKAQIRATQANEDAKDPAEAKRKVIDSFAALGIMPNQLADFLGHDVATVQPADLQRLRAVYSAIKEGETTWAEVMSQHADASSAEGQPIADPKAKAVTDLDAAVAKRKADREAKGGAAQAAAANTPGAKPAPATAPKVTPPTTTKPADPGAVISTGPGKAATPAASPAAAATTAVPHDKVTGEVAPEHVISTPKQRKALGEAIFGARLEEETVCKWFNVDELAALSGPQVVDALERIKILEDQGPAAAPTVPEVLAALKAVQLDEAWVVEGWKKPVADLTEDERREVVKLAAESAR